MIPIAKPYLGKEEAQAAYDTVMSGWVTQGPRVAEFEEKFARYCGSKYAVAVSNCTTALHLSLICAGISEGDEVICPSLTYIATPNAIKYTDATPIFADVNNDYNLDIEDVKSKITPKTKAILLVHQIGMPADIHAYKDLCHEQGLTLIEDAACAIGSSYKNDKIGSHSDFVCFSFHPRKVITTGDGGMITTSNEEIYNKLKLLRQHGMSINDRVRHSSKTVMIEEYPIIGYNYRMTDIQAAVGIHQLERLDAIVQQRRQIAKKYLEAFDGIANIILPIEKDGYRSNYQSFSIQLKEVDEESRNELMQGLLEQGVASRRGIMCCHMERPYINNMVDLSKSEIISNKSIIIPLFVPMEEREMNEVIQKVTSLINAI